MSDIINFQDRTKLGTFSQIKLGDGKRILVSLTQTEIAILRLAFGGNIPIGKIFKHNVSEFLDFFCVRVKQIGIEGSLLKAVVDYILPCKNMEEVAEKMNVVVDGHNDPTIKKDIQKKLQKQVCGLYSDVDNN